jgi:aspartate aminotransferase
MPKLSNKAVQLPFSPIRQLASFAENAKSKGIDVFHLNIGQPDIKIPEIAIEAIRNFKPEVVAYSHSAGIESYRKSLAQYYQKVGIDIKHENILITTGGSEAITMTLNSIIDEGDEIIIPEPFYANYNGFATASDSFNFLCVPKWESIIVPICK